MAPAALLSQTDSIARCPPHRTAHTRSMNHMILKRIQSCTGAWTVPLAAVLHPGELGPHQMAPTSCSRYRVVGSQMAGGVSPCLVSALRHAFITYYSLLKLHTEARLV